MSKQYDYWEVFAFSDKPGYGNPAGVVWCTDDMSGSTMQKIAKINGLSETAFIFPSKQKETLYNIKFFTPVKPIPMCGHASIASAYVYWFKSGMPENLEYCQGTDSGILNIKITVKDAIPSISLEMDMPKLIKPLDEFREEMCTALGIRQSSLRNDLPIMINEKEYLYIPVKSLSTIKNMKPDFQKLLTLDSMLHIHGWYIFTEKTLHKDSNIHCRFFAPSYGITEDPVTGTANAYFCEYYLKYMNSAPSKTLIVEQGYEIGKNGKLTVSYESENGSIKSIHVGGNASIYINGSLSI